VKGKADNPGPDKAGLERLPKAKLIAMILEQREETRIRLEEKDQRITELSEQLAKLQGEIDKEKAEQEIKEINKQVNQPSSKKPEGRTRTATRSRQQRARRRKRRRKSAKREPAVATRGNPASRLTRHI
jgi:TolA-binding protein